MLLPVIIVSATYFFVGDTLFPVFVPAHNILRWFLAFVSVAIIAVCSILALRIPCPRCAQPLGKIALFVGSGRIKGPASCPHCDVSIDEEMDISASTPAQSSR